MNVERIGWNIAYTYHMLGTYEVMNDTHIMKNDNRGMFADIVDPTSGLAHIDKLDVYLHERRAISSAASRRLGRLDTPDKIRSETGQRDLRVPGESSTTDSNPTPSRLRYFQNHIPFQ